MPRGQKRDRLATTAKCFLDARSFVSREGHDYLYGDDVGVRRQMVWVRSKGYCEEPGCNRRISEETFEMHHKKSRGRGGSDDLENLEALCKKSHRRKHRNREPRWTKQRPMGLQGKMEA